MGFTKKTWKNRIAEYINRRLITMEDGSTNLVTVARDEGTISQEGDAFNAANMNDLEDRIEAGFADVSQSLTIIKENLIPFPYCATSTGSYAKSFNSSSLTTVEAKNDGSLLIGSNGKIPSKTNQVLFRLIHDNFENIALILDALNLDKIDGMLFDLGVSSPQLDDGARGFSYMADAPLDMRMDRSQALTAYDVVNNWPRAELKKILFEYGEERYAPQIAAAIEHDEATTRKIIHRLQDKYEAEDRGLRIIELEDSFQLCTKREMYDYLIRIAKQPKKCVLTDVLLETLSIIAYRQPVTKLEIEKIRGVKSDHAVNKLVEYNLACEVGRLDAPGRPILFGTTEEFLRRFSIQSIEDLPSMQPEQVETFKEEAEEEVQLKLNV